jgi:gas vesicle protein
MNESGRKMLHENSIEQLDEFALFDKIKKGLSNVNKKVRDKFTQMFNWIKEKVNNAFNWIKKQGEKMLSLILKFFNIQVTSVKLTGKGPELFTQ